MQWRYIPFERHDPYVKTALNEVAMDTVADSGVPLFWLAGWNKPCVNIGYGQKLSAVVNLEEVEKNNLVVVRRQGGGGATLLTQHGEVSWALIAPISWFANDPNTIYSQLCTQLAQGLQAIGITARHKPINDVVTDLGKISGATLKKTKSVIYFAGTLLYESNKELMNKLFHPEKDVLKKENIPEKDRPISSISAECSATFDEAVTCLQNIFLAGKSYDVSSWTQDELQKAYKLAEKYQSREWIYD